MKLPLFLFLLVLSLFSCREGTPQDSNNVYFCEVSVPYAVGMGYEIFEDSTRYFSKYSEVNGLTKGDLVWEIGNLEKITLECGLSNDLNRLFSAKQSGLDSQMLLKWHMYSVILVEDKIYGISINLVDRLIKCEILTPVSDHENLLRRAVGENNFIVVEIDFIKTNTTCFYSILNNQYASSKLEIDSEVYLFR